LYSFLNVSLDKELALSNVEQQRLNELHELDQSLQEKNKKIVELEETLLRLKPTSDNVVSQSAPTPPPRGAEHLIHATKFTCRCFHDKATIITNLQ
jgi:hypothetical protein